MEQTTLPGIEEAEVVWTHPGCVATLASPPHHSAAPTPGGIVLMKGTEKDLLTAQSGSSASHTSHHVTLVTLGPAIITNSR